MQLFCSTGLCRRPWIRTSSPGPGLRQLSFLATLFLALSLAVSGDVAQAQHSGSKTVAWSGARPPAPFWANRGHWILGFQVGYAVENAIPRNISHINLLIAQPQIGLAVSDFQRGPVRRFEVLNEGILGNSVHPGGHLLGNSLLFRFDGKPYKRIMPFLDVGAGVLHTRLDARAPELSGHLQFLPQAGLGVQYFFRPQRAVVFEYRYVHMSNAGIEQPNEGYNASMLTVGFRWLRRPRVSGE